jgi:hypothetical protein
MTAISTTFERSPQMQIRTRFGISADGYVTTPEGWPAVIADPSFVSVRATASRSSSAAVRRC